MHDNPHDAFFKLVFADPLHAAGELRSILPPAIAARIPWATLKLVPGSFVDEQLARSHADLLFAAQVAGHEALVYFLFEHLSTVERLLPFRLLCYEVRIWQRFLATHPLAKKLPVILPIVLHHSETGWRAETAFDEVLDVAPELRAAFAPFVPRFHFLLDDVSRASDRDLRRRAMTALGKLALFCLRDVRRPAVLLQNLSRWADLFTEVLAAPHGAAAARAVLKYIAAAGRKLPPEEIQKIMEHPIATGTEDAEGTLGDQLREYFMDDTLREVLLLLLPQRFGELPESAKAQIRAANTETLRRWLLGVFDAKTLDELLAET